MLLYNARMKSKDYLGAADVLQTLLRVDPTNSKAHLLSGQLFMNRLGDDDKAAKHFERLLELSKEHSIEQFYGEYAHYYLGYISYKKGIHEKAVYHLKETINLNEQNRPARAMLIDILMAHYLLDDAINNIELYFKLFSENAKMHAYLGRIYYLRNDIKAVAHLRKASEQLNYDGLLSKALLMELSGQGHNAVGFLKIVSKKYNGYISPHVALGKIHEEKKDIAAALAEYIQAGTMMYETGLHAEALRVFSKVLSLKEGIAGIYIYQGKIYEEKNQIDTAILNYRKAHELKVNGKLLSHIGYLYFSKNDFKNAIKYFDSAIAIDPNDSQSHFLKGITYSHERKFPKAEDAFQKAIKIKEDDLYLYYLAGVQEKQNKINETIRSLKRAIEINPENSRAYNYLGYLYADRNMNLEESVRLVQRALEMEPENGAYLDSLGWAFYRQKKYSKALDFLLRAEINLEKDGSPDPVVYDHIGDVYRKIGKMNEAVKYWQKAYQLNKAVELKKKIERHGKK
jgi:tetratricopeptide (TPR) repeat protein